MTGVDAWRAPIETDQRRPWVMRVCVDDNDAQMPARVHLGDAGYDLYTSTRTIIPAGQFRDVPCGIRIQLPPHHWGLIKGRSSTLRRRGLLVNEAVIDNGYIGQIYVGCWNLGNKTEYVEVGDRVGQLILLPIVAAPLIGVDSDDLESPDGRGENGFGSSGH